MDSLIIIGASGHGGVMAEIADKLDYSVKFWDDDLSKKIFGYEVEKRLRNDP